MKKFSYLFLFIFWLFTIGCTHSYRYNLGDYGLQPHSEENISPLITKAIQEIASLSEKNDSTLIVLPKGKYNFYPEGAFQKEYFISNHDQDNPKSVGFAFENMKNVIFDAQGSELIFHGRMLPFSLINSENCTLKNFSVDFENPHISQVEVLENDTINGTITYRVAPWVKYEVRDSAFISKGYEWEHISTGGIAFEGKTKRLVYTTSDMLMGTKNVVEVEPYIIKSFGWYNEKLVPGSVLAMRAPGRPTPGIFISNNKNTIIKNIKIHYAEGMGLLAQVSENITLDSFSVCLRGKEDPRYFTAQADATHFSGCKGKIVSVNGLYEGMMDDAINVHGIYLSIKERVNNKTMICEYAYPQTYGFDWGVPGDTVQFINAETMELIGEQNHILSIEPVGKLNSQGAKQFKIIFINEVDSLINKGGNFGVENITWTPEVYFASNVIRNNRARGTLFSSPRKTIIEKNIFDHTSGTAILLCGDCNGWYETGACRDVLIRDNKFINSLTNMFQFTNAIISIYPEIPDLQNQKKYFHSNIIIEDNLFETFDAPIVYAKSVDGLTFRNNIIRQNEDYPAFHWNKHRFFFQRVVNATIKDNQFDEGFDKKRDIRVEN